MPELLDGTLHAVDGDDGIGVGAGLLIGDLDGGRGNGGGGTPWSNCGGGEACGGEEGKGESSDSGEVHCEAGVEEKCI